MKHEFEYRNNLLKVFVLLCILCFLSACAHNDQATIPRMHTMLGEQTGQNGRACIRTSDIRGYGVNDDVITIRTSRTYYVATTLYVCHDLDLAPRALFSSRFSEACGGTAYITTTDTRCPIQSIYEFENRKAAFAAIEQAESAIQALKTSQNKPE